MSIAIYQLFGHLLLPFILIYFAFRITKDKNYKNGFLQRFGFIKKMPEGGVHFHCASIGEVKAAAPLINYLLNNSFQTPIVITNVTIAGRDETIRLFGERVLQLMAPLDLFWVINRFIKKLQPKLAVFVEVEIWPQWLQKYKKNALPTILVNARISEKSFQKFNKLKVLVRPIFSSYSWVGVQSNDDYSRFKQLGVGNLQVTGNLKFSIDIPDAIHIQAREIQIANQLDNRYIWVAGSVHEVEYELIIDVHKQLLNRYPDLLLIIAPRYQENFRGVEQYIRQQKLNYKTRSSRATLTFKQQVWLIDSLGELLQFYALADIVFIGGSLIDRGGHNPLEAAALSKPILMGSHTSNCKNIVEMLKSNSALKTINNAQQLHRQLHYWFDHADERHQSGKRALQLVEENKDAAKTTILMIRQILNI